MWITKKKETVESTRKVGKNLMKICIYTTLTAYLLLIQISQFKKICNMKIHAILENCINCINNLWVNIYVFCVKPRCDLIFNM